MFTVRGKNYKCSREGPELDLKCGLLFRNVLQIDKIMIKPIQQMKVPLKLVKLHIDSDSDYYQKDVLSENV